MFEVILGVLRDSESLSSVPMDIDAGKIARRKYLTAWWTPVSV